MFSLLNITVTLLGVDAVGSRTFPVFSLSPSLLIYAGGGRGGVLLS